MKIAVTGPNGLIGKALVSRGCIPMDCDVTNLLQVQHDIKYQRPDIVVHLAAKSDVGFCQDPKNEKVVTAVNLRGAYNVFDAASQSGISVVFLSTDHVFDGRTWFSYKEDAKPNPINQYGLSKYCAEQMAAIFDNVKIVRASTVFSWKREMIQTYIREWSAYHSTFAPVQLKRRFIFLQDFANALMDYIHKFDSAPKILNLAGSECVSWYEFTRHLSKVLEVNKNLVNKRNYENHGTPRAENLNLNISKAADMGIPLPSYKDGISVMLGDYFN